MDDLQQLKVSIWFQDYKRCSLLHQHQSLAYKFIPNIPLIKTLLPTCSHSQPEHFWLNAHHAPRLCMYFVFTSVLSS